MHLRESIFHIFSYSWKERFQVEKVGGDIKLDVRIYVPLPWTKIAFESTYNKNQPDSLEKIVIKMP